MQQSLPLSQLPQCTHLCSPSLSAPAQSLCPICYKCMALGARLPCQHSFGAACLSTYVNGRPQVRCPICRHPAPGWTPLPCMATLETSCQLCRSWDGALAQLDSHHRDCPQYWQHITQLHQQNLNQMLTMLSLQINPHLQQKHPQIYNTIVKEWQCLKQYEREWNWWWDSGHEWWGGQHCGDCNRLGWKYVGKLATWDRHRRHLGGILAGRAPSNGQHGQHQGQDSKQEEKEGEEEGQSERKEMAR